MRERPIRATVVDLLDRHLDRGGLRLREQRSSGECECKCGDRFHGSGTLISNGEVTRDLSVSRWICSDALDRKSTRLNSSHLVISYAVFCLKKKTIVVAEAHAKVLVHKCG